MEPSSLWYAWHAKWHKSELAAEYVAAEGVFDTIKWQNVNIISKMYLLLVI